MIQTKIISTVYFILIFFIVHGQEGDLPCFVLDDKNDSKEAAFEINTKDVSTLKKLRINVHFILMANGTGNFSKTSDGFGNAHPNGYNIAYDMKNYINNRFKPDLNIPPNNNLDNDPFNVELIIEGIYFHNDSNFYSNASSDRINDVYGVNTSNAMQIYYRGDGVSSHASSTCNSCDNKYTSEKTLVNKYAAYQQNNTPYAWFEHTAFHTTHHEIYHLLTLSHTVRHSGGGECSQTATCNDDCADTPTPNEMANIYGYLGTPDLSNLGQIIEPHCGWGQGNEYWCSNNLMDYSSSAALSPCQLNKVHTALENGLSNYTVCEAVVSDMTICEIGYPKISHFGKRVLIDNCNGVTPTLENEEKNYIYSSEQVEIESIEIEANSEFEIIFEDQC